MEETLELMIAEFEAEILEADKTARVYSNNKTYWISKIQLLNELKKRSKKPWEVRTLQDYDSRS